MASQILVPMDDSELAALALEHALDEHPDAEITVLHVVGGGSPMMGEAASVALADEVEGAAREQADEVFESARGIAAERGRELDTELAFGSPAKVIVERAAEFDAVVMGTHGGTLSERLFSGNVAERVFRRSPVPVTTVR
ncbi:universal stress protein [Halobacterium sp. CBA1126]|uniref:universal stress protein n=1 Tax=Halobacterium sp. CBA1126 TaxID=2668074 RepID=UPI0012FA8644|nr:universal stress protein [Halobacterium sp. CBA1126]MUV61865.1 universal stress protein [Halobacterium sp. CBA1126]